MLSLTTSLMLAPPVVEKILDETRASGNTQLFFNVRSWVAFAGSLLFAGGLLACAPLAHRTGWLRLALAGTVILFGLFVTAAMVRTVMPRTGPPEKGLNTWDLVFLGLAVLRPGAVLLAALTVRGLARWMGVALAVLALLLFLGGQGLNFARRLEYLPRLDWERWASWGTFFVGLALCHLAAVTAAMTVLFKPAAATAAGERPPGRA